MVVYLTGRPRVCDRRRLVLSRGSLLTVPDTLDTRVAIVLIRTEVDVCGQDGVDDKMSRTVAVRPLSCSMARQQVIITLSWLDSHVIHALGPQS